MKKAYRTKVLQNSTQIRFCVKIYFICKNIYYSDDFP